MKWQCLYGPSRVLFTIKEEEEREVFESEYSASAPADIEFESVVKANKVYFSESVSVVGRVEPSLSEEEVAVTMELTDTTPFSTPCGSPPYYTPSSSPLREVVLMGCPTHSVAIPEDQEE
ncbi:hypothetical protein L6164_033934 [Bauhinia variegata]|nr:hypothetical protein L6164_033934 [Bauhinia variegata]